MAEYPNPLAAAQMGWNDSQARFDQFARQRAGKALAQGDYAGGANALFHAGDVEGGFKVQDQQRQQEHGDPKEIAAKFDMLGKIAASIRRLPLDARKGALSQFRQTFAGMGLPTQVIQQMEAADLSDQTLDAFAGQMEQEKWQILQRRDGSVVGVNPKTLEQRQVLEPMAGGAGRQAPFGWEYDENGDPVPIDSFVRGKARIAGATRAPRVGRRGGGHSSGGYSGLPPGYRPK